MIIDQITSCRTQVLGGHVLRCDHCGHQQISYNSCRNRHCPKCQSLNRARWVEDRRAELLPVPYFHVVFTFPECLNPVALYNKTVVYNLLLRAVSETLKEVAAALQPKAEPLPYFVESQRRFTSLLFVLHYLLGVGEPVDIQHDAHAPPVVAFLDFHIVMLEKLLSPIFPQISEITVIGNLRRVRSDIDMATQFANNSPCLLGQRLR